MLAYIPLYDNKALVNSNKSKTKHTSGIICSLVYELLKNHNHKDKD